MRRKNKLADRTKAAAAEDDVETLLRAAEDELLLNLTVNSHAARGSSHAPSSYLDPDLHRRFQSLKTSKPTSSKESKEKKGVSGSAGPCGDEDLFKRFAALKGSGAAPVPPGSGSMSVDDDDDIDEVEKVMRWAIDAARLDPSPESDIDDDVDSDLHTSSDDDDDEDNTRSKDLKKKKENKK